MSQWGFWDWVAYGGLWAAALILAIETALVSAPTVSAIIPQFFKNPRWNFAPAGLLILSTAIFGARAAGWIGATSIAPPAQFVAVGAVPTSLTVRFDDPNNATLVAGENIRGWYFLQNGVNVQSLDPKTLTVLKTDSRIFWNLFVTFEKPAAVRQITVHGGPTLPPYEIKVFNQYYTVIIFIGDLKGQTVTIEALI